jgi:hypothetical protein
MDVGSQLIDAPWSACDSNDRYVEVTMFDHGLQGRKDLFIGQIAGDTKKNERI